MAVTLPPFTSSAVISGSTLIQNADEQLNIFMQDAKSYMTTSFNSASSQLVTEVTNSIVANSVTATKSSTTFNTTANTWYRIATSSINIDRNSGVFVVDWFVGGYHGVIRFSAGCHYGFTSGTSIQQLELTSYAASLFSEARIVYHTTYTGKYAYVEIKASVAVTGVSVNVELQDAIGWSLVSPSTLRSIPSGYTSYTHTFVNIASTTAGTFPKVTFNKEGRVTAGSALVEADVPSLNASKITAGTLPVTRGGTGVSTSTGTGSVVRATSPTLVTPNIGVATGTSFNSITGLASVAPLAAGTATVGTSTLTARQDHVHPAQTTITGNAGTATKLATARTITLTGGVTGSASFDGTTNVSITSTVQDNSHNHTTLTSVDNIGFNLANVIAPTAGQLAWNPAEETLDLGLDDEVTLQIGQELLVRGKNVTGATIPNGRVLMATGAVGNSGVITIGLHNGVQATGFKIAGISTEDISNNEIGFSLLRGKLRGINCTGSQFGEVWNVGDGLWVSPNGGGAMTNIEPSVDQLKMFIGVVINNTANGTIQVRTNGIDENHYVEYVGTIEEFEGALI